MEYYRLSYLKGHWTLLHGATGLVHTVFLNKPKIQSLALAHAEVADKTGIFTICTYTGEVEEVINLPCPKLPPRPKGKRRYMHVAVLRACYELRKGAVQWVKEWA